MTRPAVVTARSELRLVISSRPTATGNVDGQWWPRTRDLAVEIPALVAAVTARLGAVDRVCLSPDAWDGRAHRIASLDDRMIRLDWFAARDRHMITLIAGSSHLDLLVIPPDTAPVLAVACLSVSTMPGPTPTTLSVVSAPEAGRP